MAFNVSSLPEYVEQHKGELISKAVFSPRTASKINLMTGVKHKEALNVITTDPTLQERACSFSANGDVTFTQRIMTVGRYMVNIELCPETLSQKWMNVEVATKAGAEVLPFEEQITNEIVDDIARKIEKKLWTASTALTQNPDLFDGLLTLIKADTSITAVTSTATTTYGKVKDVYMAIPTDIMDKAAIFVGLDTFRALCMDLTTQNLYHYVAEVDNTMEIILPGTNTKVIGVYGLNGTDAIVASDPMNLYYGVDMANDAEVFKLWYSEDNQSFRLAVKFNAGTQYAFSDQIAYYVPAVVA